jgi:hypothetical protein
MRLMQIVWPILPNEEDMVAEEWSITNIMEASSHYKDVDLPPMSPNNRPSVTATSSSTGAGVRLVPLPLGTASTASRPISPAGVLSKQGSGVSELDPSTPNRSRSKSRKSGLNEIMGVTGMLSRKSVNPSFADLYPKASSETKVF